MNPLQLIADEITAVYPNSQFEPGKDNLSAKVVGPTGSFILSHAADNFYVVRVDGRQMTTHHYNPLSEQREKHLHEFVARFV